MWPRGFKSRTPRHQLNTPRFQQEIYNTIDGMEKDQLAKLTIFHTVKKLKLIAKSADLSNPNSIVDYLAEKKGKRSYIEALALAYNRYARYNGLKWKPPKIIRDSQPPYVPTAEELTILISDAGKKYSLILSIFRDTGMRPIEIERMTRSWFNEEQGSIRVETAKHGLGRTLKLKSKTADMLRVYLEENKFNLNDHPFPKSKTMRTSYRDIRKRTAEKLHRPKLLKVCLYSFRHYYASKLYRDTQNIVLVQRKLGHRRIQQTLTYIHSIVDICENDDYTTATAETIQDDCKLLEAGFQYVTERDGIKIYRKRK